MEGCLHQHPAKPVREDSLHATSRYLDGGYFIVPEAVTVEAPEAKRYGEGTYPRQPEGTPILGFGFWILDFEPWLYGPISVK